MTLFADRDEHEIGSDYGRGWIVLRPSEDGIRVAVGERGFGHDEPSILHTCRLTWPEVAELRDALAAAVPSDTEPSATRQWDSPLCDKCGETIRTQGDRNSGSYRSRGRFGTVRERSGTWHRRCTPREFYERWGW